MSYILRTIVFYTLILFPTTAQSIVCARLRVHVWATYFSHHSAFNT